MLRISPSFFNVIPSFCLTSISNILELISSTQKWLYIQNGILRKKSESTTQRCLQLDKYTRIRRVIEVLYVLWYLTTVLLFICSKMTSRYLLQFSKTSLNQPSRRWCRIWSIMNANGPRSFACNFKLEPNVIPKRKCQCIHYINHLVLLGNRLEHFYAVFQLFLFLLVHKCSYHKCRNLFSFRPLPYHLSHFETLSSIFWYYMHLRLDPLTTVFATNFPGAISWFGMKTSSSVVYSSYYLGHCRPAVWVNLIHGIIKVSTYGIFLVNPLQIL